MALRQFVAAAMKKSNEDLALTMPDCTVLSSYRLMQEARELDGGLGYDLFYFASDRTVDSRESLADVAPHFVEMREVTRALRLPPVMGDAAAGPQDEVAAPLTARIVANVRHWLHLLRLSQLSVGVTLLDGLRQRPRLMLKLRWMRGRDPWEIARKVNFIDPTARVHPTADLECAVIGPGCEVQAHAHVHRTVLGPNVKIGDHAVVMGSTLAERVQVLSATYMALCASMPESTLANYKVQLSLFGKRVFLTSAAWLIDAKFRGSVKVEHEGSIIDTGTAFLGCCIGHEVSLGATVAIASGRAVKNGYAIVGPPENVISEIGEYPDGTVLTVRNGKVEPL